MALYEMPVGEFIRRSFIDPFRGATIRYMDVSVASPSYQRNRAYVAFVIIGILIGDFGLLVIFILFMVAVM